MDHNRYVQMLWLVVALAGIITAVVAFILAALWASLT